MLLTHASNVWREKSPCVTVYVESVVQIMSDIIWYHVPFPVCNGCIVYGLSLVFTPQPLKADGVLQSVDGWETWTLRFVNAVTWKWSNIEPFISWYRGHFYWKSWTNLHLSELEAKVRCLESESLVNAITRQGFHLGVWTFGLKPFSWISWMSGCTENIEFFI